MSALNAEQRGDMVETLMPEAAGLVVDVHEGSADDIKTRLQGLTRHELEAMAVLLAALVDPDRSLKDALAWVTFDEAGEPLERKYKSRSTRAVRDMAPPVLVDRNAGLDVVAVDRALSPGPHVRLNSTERRFAVERGIRRGMTYSDVAERLQMDREAVQRSWERAKRRAREEGRWVPPVAVGEIRSAA